MPDSCDGPVAINPHCWLKQWNSRKHIRHPIFGPILSKLLRRLFHRYGTLSSAYLLGTMWTKGGEGHIV